MPDRDEVIDELRKRTTWGVIENALAQAIGFDPNDDEDGPWGEWQPWGWEAPLRPPARDWDRETWEALQPRPIGIDMATGRIVFEDDTLPEHMLTHGAVLPSAVLQVHGRVTGMVELHSGGDGRFAFS